VKLIAYLRMGKRKAFGAPYLGVPEMHGDLKIWPNPLDRSELELATCFADWGIN
jgi:hypothetical protein